MPNGGWLIVLVYDSFAFAILRFCFSLFPFYFSMQIRVGAEGALEFVAGLGFVEGGEGVLGLLEAV